MTSSYAPGCRGRHERSGSERGRPFRVVIVDDDALVRAALSMILRDADAIETVARPMTGRPGWIIARVAPDVVLMDIRMPRMDGLEALARLRRQPHHPR